MFDKKFIEQLKAKRKEWEAEFRKLNPQCRNSKFTTLSGEEIKDLYTPLDLEKTEFDRDLNFPGEYPYTRGIRHSMYRGRQWTMRQFSGFGSPRQSNERYKFLLRHGQMGLSVAYDLPTLMGHDSTDPWSEGEVGVCGVALDSLRDMEILFDGIDLGKITTSMTINGPAPIVFAMYLATGEKQGVPVKNLAGTCQTDILKEYIAQKEWIFPPKPSMRLIVDMMKYCTQYMPKYNYISISGYHIREAGSTAIQELAFTLADGFAYVEAGLEAGLKIDDFAPRLSFFFNSHLDFFEEIAKYRAARRIWARHMREKYKAQNPNSWLMRFHTQTAGVSLTAQQPENNIVRTAFEGLAAVLGGTQSLHTNSMDETWALPTEKAVKIALRTQQIIAYETGVTNTIDPLGGSYFIEALTNKMEEEAERYFAEIKSKGGVLKCVEEGYFQKEIAHSAFAYQKALEKKEKFHIGVNEFVEPDEEVDIPILKIDPKVTQEQEESIKQVQKSRNSDLVKRNLDALKKAASNTDNTVPHLVECVKVYATEGEIVNALKEVYGEYREPAWF
ncbi:MAG: methylmalonyl-CoA mutase family protein [candidate division Zixibacteria bacterium]|nr:methylmalonyl-CoA mutase family protein [candidate division Zixibacteria bacterium]